MHEMAIAETLLDEVMTLVVDRGFSRVTGIEIAVGEAAAVDPASLGHVLNDLRGGTPAADAKIRVEAEPMRAFCHDCFEAFAAESADAACPLCGKDDCEVISGYDVMLVNVVGELEPATAANG